MQSKLNSNSYLASASLILLLPVLLGFVSNCLSIYDFYHLIVSADPTEQAIIQHESIKFFLTDQLYLIALLIPGLLLSSFVLLKQKYLSNWFKHSIAVLSIFMLLTLPVVSIVGAYLFFINRRLKQNA